MSQDIALNVACTECCFSQVILPEDETAPSELIIYHRRETGHTLTIDPLDDENTGGAPAEQ